MSQGDYYDATVAYSTGEARVKEPRDAPAVYSGGGNAPVLPLRSHSQAPSGFSERVGGRGGSAGPPASPLVLPRRGSSANSFAFVDFTINDETVQLNLVSAALPCAFEVELSPATCVESSRRYNCLVEMSFSLQVRHCCVKSRNLFLALRFPWGTTHYLGPLTQRAVVASARFVDTVPPSVTLIVDVDRCIPPLLASPLPCEMLLKEHVKTILENDEFCGSIAAAHVQNLVRDLPFYAAAMRRFRTWSEYVALFADRYRCWAMVVYEEEEHTSLGLSSLTPPGELRLVANHFAEHYAAADVQRDKIKWRALCDYRDQVVARSCDVSEAVRTSRKGEPAVRLPRNILRSLGSEGSFRTLNSVNYLHVLEALVPMRAVLFSALHPIQVDKGLIGNTSLDLLLAVGAR